MAVDLNAIKARLGSIPDQLMYTFPLCVRKLLNEDLPALIAESEEHRASLAAKEQTVKMGEGRKHLP